MYEQTIEDKGNLMEELTEEKVIFETEIIEIKSIINNINKLKEKELKEKEKELIVITNVLLKLQ